MSSFEINLLTREEKEEQVKTKVVKWSTIVSVFLLLIIGSASAYFFFKAQNLKNGVKAADSEIADLRSRIEEMSSVEISARNLYQRYFAIKGIFTNRVYNSFLLEHLSSKIPSGVKVNSFNFRGQTDIDISGDAPNYLAVSEFLRNLNAKEDPQVFNSATLTSVTLNSSDKSVKYAIVISYNLETLKGR